MTKLPWDRQSPFTGIRELASPVDTDISTKRQTEYTNTGNVDCVNMDYKQSREDTASSNGDTVTQDTRL